MVDPSLSTWLPVSKPKGQTPQIKPGSKLFASLKVDNFGLVGKMQLTP